MADGVLGSPGVERRLGGLVQGVHGLIGDRPRHPGDLAELADEFRRRRRVMGEVLDLVEVLALLVASAIATPAWRWARVRFVSVW